MVQPPTKKMKQSCLVFGMAASGGAVLSCATDNVAAQALAATLCLTFLCVGCGKKMANAGSKATHEKFCGAAVDKLSRDAAMPRVNPASGFTSSFNQPSNLQSTSTESHDVSSATNVTDAIIPGMGCYSDSSDDDSDVIQAEPAESRAQRPSFATGVGKGKAGPKSRTARSPSFKLEVLQAVDALVQQRGGKRWGVLEQIGETYSINPSLISKWSKERQEIEKLAAGKSHRSRHGARHGNVRGAAYPGLEAQLKEKILARRAKGWKVKSRWVTKAAKELARALLGEAAEKFKCSAHWRRLFRKRNKLCKRCVKKLCSSITVVDARICLFIFDWFASI